MSAPIFRFGGFELDPLRHQLRRDGQPVEIRAQSLHLLVYLVENRQRAVPKEELMELLWPGTAVADASLTSAVFRARQALGDDGTSQQWIETSRGQGYRFAGQVEVFARDAHAEPAATSRGDAPAARSPLRWRRMAVGAGVVALLLLAPAAAQLWRSRPAPPAPTPSLLVLPFEDLSPAGDHAFFARGMSEELIDTLTAVPGLAVMGRTTGEVARRHGWDAPEIGRRTRVAQVIEGSVRRSDDRLRVTVQLIRAADGFHHWSRSYDRPLGDLLDLQSEIAQAVAQTLELQLSPRRRPTESIEAWEAYRLGRALFASGARGQIWRAREHFERAVEIDPQFAPARASLASSIRMLCFVLDPNCDRARAWAEVERALEIDPLLSGAHHVRALLLLDEWNWAEAEAAARRSLELGSPDNPSYASFLLAHLWMEQGRIDEALAIFERLEARHLLDASTQMGGGMWRLVMGVDLERALELFERARELTPALAHLAFLRSDVLRLLGRQDAALQEILESEMPAEEKAAVREAHATGGWSAVHPLLTEYRLRRYDGPCRAGSVGSVAAARIGLGDLEGALECFEQAYRAGATHIFIHPGVSYLWDPLRGDPRFQAILAGMNLSEAALERVRAYRDCSGSRPAKLRCRELRPRAASRAVAERP